MGMQNGSKLEIVLCPTLCEWAWLRPYIHINVTTFTRFVQNCNNIIGGLLALYGSTMHVATLYPYPKPSFPALQCCTLKVCFSVCSTAKLGIRPGDHEGYEAGLYHL